MITAVRIICLGWNCQNPNFYKGWQMNLQKNFISSITDIVTDDIILNDAERYKNATKLTYRCIL